MLDAPAGSRSVKVEPTPTSVSAPPPTPAPGADDIWDSVDSWVYQLSGYQDDRLDQIAASAFDLAVIDLARDGNLDTFTRAEIRAVQDAGKVFAAPVLQCIVCRVNIRYTPVLPARNW